MAKLIVIATPIGNRRDLSLRAADLLKNVELIVSESPSASQKLIKPLASKAKVIPFFSPGKKVNYGPVLEKLQAGGDVALISEAGTPGINDPGGQLVARARAEGFAVTGMPGPNAAILTASLSGFPMDEFVFKGFVPHKKGRQTFFKELVAIESSVIFYESPHRIKKTLQALAEFMPGRFLCVGRELTKLHEQIIVDQTQKIAGLSDEQLPARGEFVLVLAPKGLELNLMSI